MCFCLIFLFGRCNMQVFDTGITGTQYYAIRVDTDVARMYYGNIRMSSINFT